MTNNSVAVIWVENKTIQAPSCFLHENNQYETTWKSFSQLLTKLIKVLYLVLLNGIILMNN